MRSSTPYHIDPRPLFAAGLDPIYLLHAQSYLVLSHKTLLVSAVDGKIIPRKDPRWQIAQAPYNKSSFAHLGQRDHSKYGSAPQLEYFREQYPSDVWADLIGAATTAADSFLNGDLRDYAAEEAERAATDFKRRADGWEAGLRWQQGHGLDSVAERAALEDYRRAAELLVAGIHSPLRKLESLCFYSPIGPVR